MIGACVDYINSVALVESYLSIVQFNGAAEILSPLTLILTDEDRAQLVLQLIGSLPNPPGGGTCIECGLRDALQVSKQKQSNILCSSL